MTSRPTRIAQTTKEAKRDYQRHGQQFSATQRRQLERAIELDQRAARFKANEERRADLKRKREEKERKEREERRQLGVGLATQLVGFSHTQAQLKSGMEAFLGLNKKKADQTMNASELSQKLEAFIEKEPWDDLDNDDLTLDDLPDLAVLDAESLIDDDLDDDTLLEAHDQVVLDAVEEVLEPAAVQHLPPIPPALPIAKPLLSHTKPSINEDADFARLHGPINKVIEVALEQLPHPLVEFLSIDVSTDASAWDPPSALLHKLNPIGLPPHRLRVKVGCTAVVLRDLNTSSQLSRSSHLQIMRVEQERLECLILDGQLEGTTTFLTRVPFLARYRNDGTMPFQRFQFPIRVSTECRPMTAVREPNPSSFKPHAVSGQPGKGLSGFKKPTLPASKIKLTQKVNPTFKAPSKSACKTLDKVVPSNQAQSAYIASLDGWDDFLDSATQIARDLSSNNLVEPERVLDMSTSLPFSTQDFDFDLDDLEEVALQPHTDLPLVQPSTREVNFVQDAKTALPQQREIKTKKPRTPRKYSKPMMAPLPRPKLGPGFKPLPPIKGSKAAAEKKAKKSHKPAESTYTMMPATTSLPSFDDFGLSTQEAVSFFDDDDFSSPTISV